MTSLRIPNINAIHLVFILLAIVGAIFPEITANSLSFISNGFIRYFGWMVMLLCAAFVCFCVVIACSRFGHITIGKDGEPPRYGTFSWLAMLFAAGMGSGLLFYGAAEPLLHFVNPPPMVNDASNQEASARHAMAITFFHWGIHAWSIYAAAALVIAYFTFRKGKPMLPSAALTQNPIIATLVNSMAIIAVVFGVIASLSQGVLQLSDGIFRMMSMDESSRMTLKMMVLACLCVAYTLSASTSLAKGIKTLSNINMILAVSLLLFVLLTGPTLFILQSFVSGIGDYLDNIVQFSFNMRQFSDHDGWLNSWTVTYFMWWVAWAPFVGVFIARISQGRTMREFMLGVIFVPTVFSALWFSTLGSTAIHLEMFSHPGFTNVIALPERTTFAMLSLLPLADIMSFIALILLFMFLVTSADSGTYVLSMFTHDGALRPPKSERIFWGTMIGVATAGTVLTGGGTEFFRSVAVFGGIPYIFVMIWQMRGFWKSVNHED